MLGVGYHPPGSSFKVYTLAAALNEGISLNSYWRWQPYATRDCRVPGLDRLTFVELLEALEPELYDVRTGRGAYIVLNPAKMQARSGITVIALAETWHRAAELADESFPESVARKLLPQRAK